MRYRHYAVSSVGTKHRDMPFSRKTVKNQGMFIDKLVVNMYYFLGYH